MDKKDLKIVFLGTPEFAVESLDKIWENGFNIVGVVTMPDKQAGRGHGFIQSPVKQWAVAHDIKLMQPTNLKAPEFVEELRSLNADLFVVIAFRMLPEAVWTMPRLGTFNLHASLLPKYRGAAPINWAVMNGDTVTGVTTFFLKHEIDTGDIIDRKEIAILPEDNVGDVHDKLMHLGAELTVETLNNILNGTLHPIPQDKLTASQEPTPAPKIFKETRRIDWTRTAEEVHNQVRGLSPYPGSWTEWNTAEGSTLTYKIYKTALTDKKSTAQPGTIIVDNNHLMVACADKMLEILNLQAEGKRKMNADEFLRGLHVTLTNSN